MMDIAQGKFVKGYLASNDLTTAAAVPLFDADGNSVTLAAGERVVIYAAILSNGATASIITLFSDADASGAMNSGEEIVSAALAVNTAFSFPAAEGFALGRRATSTANSGRIMAVASAASVGQKITLIGQIITV
jgi:hypothetical protein